MDDIYNPMKKDIQTLQDKVASLEAQLKEKDLQVDEEVRYKLEERKKAQDKDLEIMALKEKLALSFSVIKDSDNKILEIAKEIAKVYGKEITDKKH
jgi:hypothetical protein